MSASDDVPEPDEVAVGLFENAERVAHVAIEQGMPGVTPEAIAMSEGLLRDGLERLLDRLRDEHPLALYTTIGAMSPEAKGTALAYAVRAIAELRGPA